MILSDREMQQEIERGELIFSPPVSEVDYSTTAVDLHLSETYWVPKQPHAALQTSVKLNHTSVKELINELYEKKTIPPEGINLSQSDFILALTREHVTLPPHLHGWVEGKSTQARYGLVVHMTAPTVHAKWEGQLMLEMSLLGKWECTLVPGMAICQLILARVGMPPRTTRESDWKGQNPSQLLPPKP